MRQAGAVMVADEPLANEEIERFPCFGGSCSVLVTGDGPAGSAREAVTKVKRGLLAWHRQFSRFEPESELSRLNRDPRTVVSVTPVMARFVEAPSAPLG